MLNIRIELIIYELKYNNKNLGLIDHKIIKQVSQFEFVIKSKEQTRSNAMNLKNFIFKNARHI